MSVRGGCVAAGEATPPKHLPSDRRAGQALSKPGLQYFIDPFYLRLSVVNSRPRNHPKSLGVLSVPGDENPLYFFTTSTESIASSDPSAALRSRISIHARVPAAT